MSDGGYICLDWFNERGKVVGEDSSDRGNDPIVLILPGVTGNVLSLTVYMYNHVCHSSLSCPDSSVGRAAIS